MNSTVKSILFWVFILACLVLLWQIVQKSTSNGKDQEISFSTFMDDARQGQVQDVTINDNTVTGHFRNNKDNGFHTTVPANYPDMYKTLQDNKVSITVKNTQGSAWWPILLQLSPNSDHRRCLVFHDPPNAERRKQGAVIRQEPRPAAFHAAEKGHVQGRGRRG